jgi:hypothetical protein
MTKPYPSRLFRQNMRVARQYWGRALDSQKASILRTLTSQFHFVIAAGDLILTESGWYVTHAGLLRLARTRRCKGIQVEPVEQFSTPTRHRFAFKATVHKSSSSAIGFVGYGDAEPSNVSSLMHGAEMRVAETRAVNRALRKAYGIGICSVEEIGSFAGTVPANREPRQTGKLPPQPAHGNGSGGHGHNGNGNGSRVRDRLCQLIRQHQLDAHLVKSYATDFCGTKTLREATREQVENFVVHLADWAEKDRNALLCQLNSYSRRQAGAA